MNIGDVVGLVQEVEGFVQKVPAIVTKVYQNAHGEVVADLHKLETTVSGVISKDDNPTDAVPTPAEGPHVTADLSPEVPANVQPDAALTQAESDVSHLDDADYQAFLAWKAQQAPKANTTTGGDGSPS